MNLLLVRQNFKWEHVNEVVKTFVFQLEVGTILKRLKKFKKYLEGNDFSINLIHPNITYMI